MNFEPLFRTPLSEVVHPSIFTNQFSPNELCRTLELNLIRCFEAYGRRRGQQNECRDYEDDLRECTLQKKQKRRLLAIGNERLRQNRYEPPPKYDAY